MTIGWGPLLGAALEAGLGVLAEAGFGDEARDLKERLTRRTEKARLAAFDRAFERAAKAAGEERLRPLLAHPPFREGVVAGLLDPVLGFDLQAAVAEWEGRLPSTYLPGLRRFFNALEGALLVDETWGPLLERFQALRFRQDVLAVLEDRGLDVPPGELVSRLNAELTGSGAVAQDGSVAAGAGGLAVGGDVEQAVQVVIQQLVVQHARPSPVGPAPEDLCRRYLTELGREANRLPWTIVEREYAHPERGEALGLSEVYTALDTTEMERVDREEELRRFMAQLAQGEARRIPAQEMVNEEARLLILGDPGSGKSTFVNHLAYTLAQANLAPDPAPWLGRMDPWDHGLLLPVPVRLRTLAEEANGEGGGDASLLLGHLHNNLRVWRLGGFWPVLEEAIRGEEDGRLLVLLDGLDEVPTTLRGTVVEAVQDFADRYRRHRYVVTCRPYAYVGQPHQLRGFREVTLAPFDEDQINHFIATWYRELARRERLSAHEAEEQTKRLQRAVQRGDLRGLAQWPLLLTVMTLLHTFRGQLPQDRTELYADAVDLLLRRWESRVSGEEGVLERLDMPGLKMSDLEAGLYEVAFRAHRGAKEAEGTADIDEADLRKWLAPYLGDDWNKAGVFVDYIRERAGLLVRHKGEAYTFPHRTFQEFMAACRLVGMKDYPGEAARMVRGEPDRWTEVFVLAAGYAARTHRLGEAIGAVNSLCPQEVMKVARLDGPALRRARLAGEALLEIGLVGVRREEAGRAALDRVQDWLVAAMGADEMLGSRERVEAGDTLAHLSDPRFRADARYLPDESLLGFVEVPAGPFLMGSDKAQDGDAYDDELPQHTVELPAYYVARYPVTVAQFRVFVNADGYREPRYWREAAALGVWQAGQVKGRRDDEPRDRPYDYGEPFNLSNHPVVGVTWYEAVAYCRWLTERLQEWEGAPEPLAGLLRGEGWRVRLPSEAEWEKAARGTEGRLFPWGDGPDPDRANYGDTGIGTTSAVGCFPGGASPHGVLDLSGNVWEWTHSLWGTRPGAPDFRYPYDPEDGREDESAGSDVFRVLRGGSFYFVSGGVRCAFRLRNFPVFGYGDWGFRLVVAPNFTSGL
jgi:formylglycine-generating enzyme required for sulfatase activity/energy-coupling factor transporter ATP-binding protein EcfA2